MTYQEYKNQAEASWKPNVIFNPDTDKEFKRYSTINVGADTLTSWLLDDKETGWSINYVEKNHTGRLFTTDGDGNPKHRSVFQLEIVLVAKYMKEWNESEKIRLANRFKKAY